MQVFFTYDEQYFCHFIVLLFLFHSHMIRGKGTKCFVVVHTSHYPSASEVFRVKKNFESTIFIVQYSVLYSSLLLKDTRLPQSHFIHVLKKPQPKRCKIGSGCCYLVHGVTFDFCNSHIWTLFLGKLCVSLAQSEGILSSTCLIQQEEYIFQKFQYLVAEV